MSREDFLQVLVDEGPSTYKFLRENAAYPVGTYTFQNMVRDGLITVEKKIRKETYWKITAKGKRFLAGEDPEYPRGTLYAFD